MAAHQYIGCGVSHLQLVRSIVDELQELRNSRLGPLILLVLTEIRKVIGFRKDGLKLELFLDLVCFVCYASGSDITRGCLFARRPGYIGLALQHL